MHARTHTHTHTHTHQELEVQIGEVTLLLDEKLLFKLLQWAGVGEARGDERDEDEVMSMLTQRSAACPQGMHGDGGGAESSCVPCPCFGMKYLNDY